MFRNKSRLLAAALCLGLAPAASMGGNAGTYLAGRVAGMEADHARAAEYFTRALALDAQNPALMELALTAQVNLGNFDSATSIMRRMQGAGLQASLMDIVQLTDWMEEGDYAALRDALKADFTLGDLLDGFLDQLVLGWAELGAGDAEASMAVFDAAAQAPMLRGVVLYHKALALAVSGDYAGAEALLSGESDQLRGGGLARARAADLDAAGPRGGDVDRQVARPGGHDQPQLRQRVDQRGGKGRAFAHQADHLEPAQRICRIGKRFAEEGHLRTELCPIGHAPGHARVIVQYRDLHPRPPGCTDPRQVYQLPPPGRTGLSRQARRTAQGNPETKH